MEQIFIEPSKWDSEAALLLIPALPHDPDFTINDLAYSVNMGESTLFTVTDNDGIVKAAFVLRKEGSEMVMVAVGGHLQGASVTGLLSPYVEEVAAQNGCASIRTHTRKKGIERLAIKAGWERSEVIYRKAVGRGRQVIQ